MKIFTKNAWSYENKQEIYSDISEVTTMMFFNYNIHKLSGVKTVNFIL